MFNPIVHCVLSTVFHCCTMLAANAFMEEGTKHQGQKYLIASDYTPLLCGLFFNQNKIVKTSKNWNTCLLSSVHVWWFDVCSKCTISELALLGEILFHWSCENYESCDTGIQEIVCHLWRVSQQNYFVFLVGRLWQNLMSLREDVWSRLFHTKSQREDNRITKDKTLFKRSSRKPQIIVDATCMICVG